MRDISRRSLLRGTGALASTTALGASDWASAWAARNPFAPERGARLLLLRWSGFVQTKPEKVAFERLVADYTAATGVEIEVIEASLDEVPLKAMFAATVGNGPDLIWSLNDDAHLLASRLVDVSDVAEYLGARLGGWYPVAREYGMRRDRWICLPVAIKGYYLNFRPSWVGEAGFASFPTNLADFMTLAKRLKRDGHPMGFALGNSPSDGNSWCYWLLWAFGGGVADADDRMIINRSETVAALDYVRELFPNLLPDVLRWTDKDNNAAFLHGAISVTNNPIVVYDKLRAEGNPMADDVDHAVFPLGLSGQPAELHIMYPMMLFKHSRYPNAAKSFMAFMMEHPNYDRWLYAAAGYLSHTLKAYAANPVWTEDPKRTVFREAGARSKSYAYPGHLGYAASAAFSDLVVVRMFAAVAAGRCTPKEAAETAASKLSRYFNA